jgi:hypothetical protein
MISNRYTIKGLIVITFNIDCDLAVSQTCIKYNESVHSELYLVEQRNDLHSRTRAFRPGLGDVTTVQFLSISCFTA